MAKPPRDHLVFLQKRPFAFGCSTAIFPAKEIEALEEYGNWLEALAAGIIQPQTAAQKHFLKVDREESPPTTDLERAWLRLKGRREFEHDEKIPVTPSKAEDYGMVEFDADRCWW